MQVRHFLSKERARTRLTTTESECCANRIMGAKAPIFRCLHETAYETSHETANEAI